MNRFHKIIIKCAINFTGLDRGRMRMGCDPYPEVKLLLGQSQVDINRQFDTAWGTWPAGNACS